MVKLNKATKLNLILAPLMALWAVSFLLSIFFLFGRVTFFPFTLDNWRLMLVLQFIKFIIPVLSCGALFVGLWKNRLKDKELFKKWLSTLIGFGLICTYLVASVINMMFITLDFINGPVKYVGHCQIKYTHITRGPDDYEVIINGRYFSIWPGTYYYLGGTRNFPQPDDCRSEAEIYYLDYISIGIGVKKL